MTSLITLEYSLQLLGFIVPYISNLIHYFYVIYLVLKGAQKFGLSANLELFWALFSTVYFIIMVFTATESTKDVSFSNGVV